VGRRHEPGIDELSTRQDLSRRVFHYRGYRVEKAQAGWSVWLGKREVGWGSTKVRAKQFVDEILGMLGRGT
jgi:hypothetical protein